MKCLNHKTVNAVGQCSKCKIPLCEACNMSEEDGVVMCEACAMFSTFAAMKERKKSIDEKRTNKELEESGKKQELRKKILLTAVVLASLIALIELIWYYNLSTPVVEEFDPGEEYFSTTMLINDAIVNYRNDHDGEAPDSLELLLGKYLPETDTWEKTIWSYTYKKITPYKYELSPPLAEDSPIPDISISDKGIIIFGIEYEPEQNS